MKRTHRYARPAGFANVVIEDGQTVELPMFLGLIRHPTLEELAELLARPPIARRYTRQALRVAAWPVLRTFPRAWLVACLEGLDLPPARCRALRFMLQP